MSRMVFGLTASQGSGVHDDPAAARLPESRFEGGNRLGTTKEARVTKLYSVFEVFGEPREKFPEDFLIGGGEGPGKLQHDRSHALPERSDTPQELSRFPVDVPELLLMSDGLWKLEGEAKPLRSLVFPSADVLSARETVKGSVSFNRVKC